MLVVVSSLLGACEEFTADDHDANGGGGASSSSGGPHSGVGGRPLGGSAGITESSAGTFSSAGASGSVEVAGSAGADDAGAGGSTAASGAAGSLGSAGAPSECPCKLPTQTCVAGKCLPRGPVMIKVTSFYIDSTEVTAAQYAAFMADKAVNVQAQAPECAWNDTFEPLFLQGVAAPLADQPVTNVDYCDAAAFCAWAGKRLCGRISGGGLTLPELADPSQSQWFAACGGPTGQHYPYGGAYQSKACNDEDAGKHGLVNVGAFEKCSGYYPGLFDMLGNAQEWTDTCDAKNGALDGCERIGGSYTDRQECSTSGLAHRNLRSPELGFRCCSK